MITIVTASRLIKRVVTVSLLCAFTIAAGNAPGSGVGETSAMRAGEALQLLQRFKASHSYKDLEAAIVTMRSAFEGSTFASEDFSSLRRALVRNWMQILKVIQDSYDPTFDPANPNDMPFMCLIPPVEADGTWLGSCNRSAGYQGPESPRAVHH